MAQLAPVPHWGGYVMHVTCTISENVERKWTPRKQCGEYETERLVNSELITYIQMLKDGLPTQLSVC